MCRMILRVVVMIITFTAGLGITNWFSHPGSVQAPSVQNCPPATPQIVEIVREVPAPIPVPAVAANSIFDYDTEKFTPDGGYVLMDPKNKHFRPFQAFGIEWIGPEGARSGYIWTTTTEDTFAAQPVVFGLVTTKKVFWVSKPTSDGGYEYRFDGQFVNVNFDAAANSGRPVVRGTLTKSKDGKKIAERVVSFALEQDRC